MEQKPGESHPEQESQQPSGLSIVGVAIGVALGVAFGAIADSVPVGLGVGVGLTLLTKRPVLGAAGAAAGVLIVPAALLLPLVMLPVERWGEIQRGLLVVALALAPYLLTLAVMHVSRRWV